MVNTSADEVDTMVDDQPTVLPEQGQEMREHTSLPQPPAPAPRPQTPEPRPQPRAPETQPLNGLVHLVLVTPQKPRPAAPTLGEAEAAGNTSDVDVEQQLLGKSAGGSVSNGSGLPGFGPGQEPPRNRTAQVLVGCYPDRTYTRGFLAGLEPDRGSNCTVPTTLAAIKYLSSDRIMT